MTVSTGDRAPDFITIAARPIADPHEDGYWSQAYLVYGTGAGPQPLRLQAIERDPLRLRQSSPNAVPVLGVVVGQGVLDLLGKGLCVADRRAHLPLRPR